jgi:hypothetical protein
MPKYVEFYSTGEDGDPAYQGHVVFDGKVMTGSSPKVKGILERPVLSADRQKSLTKDDGEDFLNALPLAFKNPYLYAVGPSGELSEHADLAKDDDQDEKAGFMADVLLGISPDAHDLLYEKKE